MSLGDWARGRRWRSREGSPKILGRPERLVIRMNSNVNMSRGKYAAQAVHAALMLTGRHPGVPVVVLGGKPREVEGMDVTVRDAGRTEVEPGTLTAGASWEPDPNG